MNPLLASDDSVVRDVSPRRFAVVENARQVMRSLQTALSMETAPTATGEAATQTVLAALAKMR